MLQSIYIQNYALIDTLDISFTPGFSVITGETGAGKSIIWAPSACCSDKGLISKQSRKVPINVS